MIRPRTCRHGGLRRLNLGPSILLVAAAGACIARGNDHPVHARRGSPAAKDGGRSACAPPAPEATAPLAIPVTIGLLRARDESSSLWDAALARYAARSGRCVKGKR